MAMMSLPGHASADFDAAAQAYRRNDYATAMALLMPLANSDDARAQNVVALMYKFGEGVDQDVQTAFGWYLRAARLGYPPAQYQVGVMLTSGQGTGKDLDEAGKWLTQAALNGYQRANDALAASNITPVPGNRQIDPLVPWSQQWDLTLPSDIRFADSRPETASDTGVMVQLAAMSSSTRAEQLQTSLGRKAPELFNDLNFTITEVQRDRTYYRLQAGPFANMAAARFFCERMARTGLDTGCLPIDRSR